MPRPLRTSSVQDPKTVGERIRFARITNKLSQEQLGASIGAMTKTKIDKRLVSKWESGAITNPSNAHMLAIQAVTGFSIQWLVSGTGAKRAEIPTRTQLSPIDTARMAKALRAAAPKGVLDYDFVATARVLAALYDLTADAPDIDPAMLERIAETLYRT